ncbi:MAG: glucose-6-phosphate dehydrogenase, partial [Novosphingobium sp.]
MNRGSDSLLLFGATGDRAQRLLLPSLGAIHADTLVAEYLGIFGTARQDMDDAG